MNLSSKSVNICVENTAVTMLIPEFFKTLTIKLDPEDVTPLKTKAAITEETDTKKAPEIFHLFLGLNIFYLSLYLKITLSLLSSRKICKQASF